ncbi:MAG: helix-turn-helix transcriptional regulator [Bacillota bacterium]|nr:helix-turn-helix transcriptional regulator [Bacillota bacterium]
MSEQKFSLRELRARKGWTQQETADKLGISTQTYNAWEKDISGVAVSKVQAVADLFGVKLSQIFFTQLHENNSCK